MVREEIVASRLCWIIAQGCNRRRVLIQWAVRRKAGAECEEGSATRSLECTAEKMSMEIKSSSWVSGSLFISGIPRILEQRGTIHS